MDKKVKQYIDRQEEPKRKILKELRQVLLNSIEGCQEEFKWGVPVYDRDNFYIAAMKERVHIGFAISGLSDDEVGRFEGTGKTMRHLKIYSLDDIDDLKVGNLIKLVHKKATVPGDYKSS